MPTDSLPGQQERLPSGAVLNVDFIRQRRLALKLSQQAAAEAAGLETKQAWYRIEKHPEHNVTLATLRGMAKALDCKIADLYIENPPAKSTPTRRSPRPPAKPRKGGAK